jgi:hypothetical protein
VKEHLQIHFHDLLYVLLQNHTKIRILAIWHFYVTLWHYFEYMLKPRGRLELEILYQLKSGANVLNINVWLHTLCP